MVKPPKTWTLYIFTLLCALAPMFIMAKSITDGDEAVKSTLGLATVGAIITICNTFFKTGKKHE